MARVKDNDGGWIKQSFMLPVGSIDDEDMYRRVISTGDFKFTDTTVGGNFAINPPPQFTRYADLKVGGLAGADNAYAYGTKDPAYGSLRGNTLSDMSGNASHGMGRYYSEAIDDHGQVVTMRFGVPTFNSLMMFFGGFYSQQSAILARTGRGPSLAFSAGKLIGSVVALPFQPFIIGGKLIRFFSKSPPTKFYYMNPAMPLYWNAVNTIANGLAVNMGLIPPTYTEAQKAVYSGAHDDQSGSTMTPTQMETLNRLLPGIYKTSGGLDIYSVATRAQRLANSRNEATLESLNKGARTLGALRDLMRNLRQDIRNGPLPFPPSSYQAGDKDSGIAADGYIAHWASLEGNQNSAAGSANDRAVGGRTQFDAGPNGGNSGNINSTLMGIGGNGGGLARATQSFADFFRAEARDGSNFVNFRVDFTGESSESFQNSFRESDLAGKINSQSSSSREIRFSIADGNFGEGAIANLAEDVISSVKDLMTGTLEGLKLSGLAALAGNAFVDIPKHWDNASANFPRADFTIQLRSPYGNKMSRYQNLMIPLAMLLAGTLPLSTGAHSYTSPLLCELYCRGRNSIRLGMIDSLSITRGVGNQGWTADGEPLGIDINFSVADLSSVMHMPVAAGFSLWNGLLSAGGELAGNFTGIGGAAGVDLAQWANMSNYDDDNSFTDYLAVLGSLSFNDQVYPTEQWKLRRLSSRLQFESWRSPARMANWFMGTFPGRVINALAVNTDRTN